jgi:hypothetical protein
MKEGHHNKLGKSPHARAASLTGQRKGSISQKQRVDEDASTKAIAGSNSRLVLDDSTGTENMKPLTPKSLNGDHRMELNDVPPTPPPHDHGYTKAPMDMDNDDTRRDSIRTTSTTTWRENPDAVAMRNRGAFNDADAGTAPGTTGLSGNKIMDIATARKKIQFAIEAELAADRALEIARKAVDEARAMVAALEQQAHEEYERAHAKRTETAGVVKELEKLGRHNH